MKKEDKLIMVVKRELLFKDNYFEGFLHNSSADFESRILDNFEYIKRGIAEENPEYKQPISYCVITNPGKKSLFVYQRASKDESYGEKRLQGKYSCGIGGHIEPIDKKNPIRDSLLREMSEEVSIDKIKNIKILGYLNDDSNSIGKVHFGILYVIETESSIQPKGREIESGKLIEFSKIDKNLNFEDWSRIALEALENYFT